MGSKKLAAVSGPEPGRTFKRKGRIKPHTLRGSSEYVKPLYPDFFYGASVYITAQYAYAQLLQSFPAYRAPVKPGLASVKAQGNFPGRIKFFFAEQAGYAPGAAHAPDGAGNAAEYKGKFFFRNRLPFFFHTGSIAENRDMAEPRQKGPHVFPAGRKAKGSFTSFSVLGI
jgi:hypothetical protein